MYGFGCNNGVGINAHAAISSPKPVVALIAVYPNFNNIVIGVN